MLIRELRDQDQASHNSVVNHPLQSWEWGEFRKKTGLSVSRYGFFHQGNLIKSIQVTFHPVPILGGSVGYLPKSYQLDENQLASLQQLAQKQQAIFIKLEPNVAQTVGQETADFKQAVDFMTTQGLKPGLPLFTKYTFWLDLQPSAEELFANLNNKTRYNVNLAHRKGVSIVEDSSLTGLETYLEISKETTARQGFYAHSPDYFRTMWRELAPTGMLRIFHATYEEQTLVSWMMFIFNKTLYYPYGASRSVHRDLMASNLMMWEMIKFGQSQGCELFDMWGALGPDPNPKNPWFGFHRFKKGYGGQLMEFVGTYDLVTQPGKYKLFQLANSLRWKFLRLKAKVRL